MLDFYEKMVVVRVLDNMAKALECCKPTTSMQANDVEVFLLLLVMDSVKNRNRTEKYWPNSPSSILKKLSKIEGK